MTFHDTCSALHPTSSLAHSASSVNVLYYINGPKCCLALQYATPLWMRHALGYGKPYFCIIITC